MGCSCDVSKDGWMGTTQIFIRSEETCFPAIPFPYALCRGVGPTQTARAERFGPPVGPTAGEDQISSTVGGPSPWEQMRSIHSAVCGKEGLGLRGRGETCGGRFAGRNAGKREGEEMYVEKGNVCTAVDWGGKRGKYERGWAA